MQRIKSIIKKGKTILKEKDFTKAFKEGVYNYNNPSNEIDIIALKRAEICVNCEHIKEEPNYVLKVSDEFIWQINEMMCNDCGCALPYKTRQSIIICDKWK